MENDTPDNSLDDMEILESSDSEKENDGKDTELDTEGDSDIPSGESGEGDSEEDENGESESDVENGESEEETEEEESEKEEEETPETKSLFKKLKEISPEIFKKAPELRAILGQHKQFSDIFPSVEDARAAIEDAKNFEEIREAALSGKPGAILDELHKESKDAVLKFAENFLPDVLKRSPQLYVKLTSPILANTLRNVRTAAEKAGNKNLILATQYLSKELFDSADAPDFGRKDPELEAKEQELEKKKQEFETGAYNKFKEETLTAAFNDTMQLIKNGLDPNKVMTQRQFEAAASDTFKEIEKIIKSDKKFSAHKDALWKAAKQNGYGRDASDKIVLAYLARVKPLLPGVRQKVRADYIGKSISEKQPKQVGQTKKHIPSAGTSGKAGGSIDPKNVNYRATSDEDIMSGKIKTK